MDTDGMEEHDEFRRTIRLGVDDLGQQTYGLLTMTVLSGCPESLVLFSSPWAEKELRLPVKVLGSRYGLTLRFQVDTGATVLGARLKVALLTALDGGGLGQEVNPSPDPDPLPIRAPSSVLVLRLLDDSSSAKLTRSHS